MAQRTGGKQVNQLQVFNFNSNEVRVTIIDDQPWWAAKDVYDAFDISKHRDAVSRLDEDERGSVLVDTFGGKQNVTSINEYGLFSFIKFRN